MTVHLRDARHRVVAPLALLAVSIIGAVIVSLAILTIFSRVNFPAYSTSNVLRALTTVAQFAVLVFLAAAALLTRRGERGHGLGALGPATLVRTGKIALPLGAAALTTATVGIPLAATRLYLEGISIDQEFRTQFLSRAATTWGLPDMAYSGLPSFYPSGWFWLGGRFATLANLPGWEAFKPWAIVSLSVVAAIAMVVWVRLLPTVLGASLATVLCLLTASYGSPEPYGAAVALLAPPVLIMAWHALHPTADPGGVREGGSTAGRAAMVITTVFLGISACFYTLYAGWVALTVVLMAAVSAMMVRRRVTALLLPLLPLRRLLVIGVGSAVIALLVWAPYLWRAQFSEAASSGTAVHYLPVDSAHFPLPMVEASLRGLVCLAGVVWLALRTGRSRRATALAFALAAAYLWALASMALAAVGTSLLSFRLELPITLVLAAAAVCGGFELTEVLVQRARTGMLSRATASLAGRAASRPVVQLAAAVLALTTLGLAQAAPAELDEYITVAYQDVDGYGERADHGDPQDAAYYPEMDAYIRDTTGKPRSELTVASGLPGFLALYPYWAFQSITSHYANPLGQYDERLAAMQRWASATNPAEFRQMLEAQPWGAPDVIIAEYTTTGYAVRIARDVFPNDPNVSFENVIIAASAVDGDPFTVKRFGPFAVITVGK